METFWKTTEHVGSDGNISDIHFAGNDLNLG
jgi:hypothetical protein